MIGRLWLLLCFLGCHKPSAPALPDEPVEMDLGPGPLRNPLNLYDMMIEGSPDYEVVGVVGSTKVTMRDLDAQSQGAFGRIGERMYAARDAGWRWLLEQRALERQARRAGMALLPYLRREFDQLPAAPGSPSDASAWRWKRWQVKRSMLVQEGLVAVKYGRIRYFINFPKWADAGTAEAEIGDSHVTRGELRHLAGWNEALGREEYFRIAKEQFEQHVTQLLLSREAQRRQLSIEGLLAAETSHQKPIHDEDVREYIRANPAYATGDAIAWERAKDNVRRSREQDTRASLLARLRASAKVEFYLRAPQLPVFDDPIPSPLTHGDSRLPHSLLAFHSVGCRSCVRGATLVTVLHDRYASQARLVSVDYFSPFEIGSYRGALALHCAADQDKWWPLLKQLNGYSGSGAIDDFVRVAESAGLSGRKLRACLTDDRYLPDIVENLSLATRIGLVDGVPAIFADGQRVGRLAKLDGVVSQIDAAFGSSK
jgi:hypothetical protein